MTWTPVKTRLPANAKTAIVRVLVFCPDAHCPTDHGIRIGYYSDYSKGWRIVGSPWTRRVTHWQPLPAPPGSRKRKAKPR